MPTSEETASPALRRIFAIPENRKRYRRQIATFVGLLGTRPRRRLTIHITMHPLLVAAAGDDLETTGHPGVGAEASPEMIAFSQGRKAGLNSIGPVTYLFGPRLSNRVSSSVRIDETVIELETSDRRLSIPSRRIVQPPETLPASRKPLRHVDHRHRPHQRHRSPLPVVQATLANLLSQIEVEKTALYDESRA